MEDLPNQESVEPAPQQNLELGQQALAGELDRAKEPASQAKRWGIVNAVLCGLLVVAIVACVPLCVLPMGDGSGILGWIMLGFIIPLASIPVGISCLVGALRARTVLQRHPSREARTGLRLSVGGVIAVMACYALASGILFM